MCRICKPTVQPHVLHLLPALPSDSLSIPDVAGQGTTAPSSQIWIVLAPTTGSEFGCLSVPMPEKGGSMLELLCMWRVKYLYLNISPCQSNCCVIIITFQTSNHLNQAPRSIYQSMMILYYSLFQIPLPESPFAPLLCAIDRRVPWVPACCTWKFPFRQRHNQLDVILAHRVAAEISKTRVWPLRLSVMNRITTWWLEQSWSKKNSAKCSHLLIFCAYSTIFARHFRSSRMSSGRRSWTTMMANARDSKVFVFPSWYLYHLLMHLVRWILFSKIQDCLYLVVFEFSTYIVPVLMVESEYKSWLVSNPMLIIFPPFSWY